MNALELESVNDYPTELTLRRIEHFTAQTNDDFAALLAAIRPIWTFADYGYWAQDGDTYYLSTGGWSGNEDIVAALQANYVFWAFCWRSSRRGGHHEFEVPDLGGGTIVASRKDPQRSPGV